MESAHKAIEALAAVRQSTDDIKAKLEPFLRRRQEERSAACNSAIALTLGTLCFMGGRLRGKKPDDELRAQLNQMRSLLKQAQKQEKETSETRRQQSQVEKRDQTEIDEATHDDKNESQSQKSSKRLSEENKSIEGSKKKRRKSLARTTELPIKSQKTL
jgi:hypothetical protein